MIPEYFIQEWKGSEIDYRVKQIPLTFASRKPPRASQRREAIMSNFYIIY